MLDSFDSNASRELIKEKVLFLKVTKCKLLLKFLINPTSSIAKARVLEFLVENSSLAVEITWGKELKLNIK